MGKFKIYSDFFKNVAVNNKSILHTDDKKRFYRIVFEEFLTGLRGKVDDMCLILEPFDFDFKDSRSDNILKERTGAFSLVKKIDVNDFDDMSNAYDELEDVVDEILALMTDKKQSRAHALITGFEIKDTITMSFDFSKVAGFVGFRTQFPIVTQWDPEVDGSKWVSTDF